MTRHFKLLISGGETPGVLYRVLVEIERNEINNACGAWLGVRNQ